MQTYAATAHPAVATVPEGAPALPTRISWGAVLAGALVAIAVGGMLNVLGLAVGATTIDPGIPGETPSAGTLGMAAGIWLLVANLIGLAIGGWVAARLSGTSDGTDGLLHGLAVWAVGAIISGLLVGNTVASVAGTAARGAASVVSGAAQGAGEAVGQAAQAVAPQLSNADPRAIVERLQNGLQTGGEPGAMNSDQRRAEMTQILGERVRQGSFQGNQRDRLAQLVAAEYGIPAEEAQNRINQVETQARETAAQAEAQARDAAEAASDAAATGAFWLFAAMLLGALAAMIGARMGTRHRVALPRAA